MLTKSSLAQVIPNSFAVLFILDLLFMDWQTMNVWNVIDSKQITTQPMFIREISSPLVIMNVKVEMILFRAVSFYCQYVLPLKVFVNCLL